jgi:hypothetical protein
MVLSLKGEELVNGVDGRGVSGMNSELSPLRKSLRGIRDLGSPLRHDHGAGHFAIVDEAWQGEVSPLEGKSDHLHVASNLGASSGIASVALQPDPATIGERLETMR